MLLVNRFSFGCQMVELHLVVQIFMMEKLIYGMRMKNNLYWKPMDESLKFLVENLWLIIYIDQILSLDWMYLMLPMDKIMANNGYRRNVMECGHICRLRESCWLHFNMRARLSFLMVLLSLNMMENMVCFMLWKTNRHSIPKIVEVAKFSQLVALVLVSSS